MRTIPLHGAKARGRVALVDDEDYEFVMQYRWHVWELVKYPNGRVNGPYAAVNLWLDRKSVVVRMHKLLTGYARTDHIDHDGLNNQRSNLRPVTHSQNMQNRRAKLRESSQFKGVCWSRNEQIWTAHINPDGKLRRLGAFVSEAAAARAYDAAAREAFGQYACLNFPDAV